MRALLKAESSRPRVVMAVSTARATSAARRHVTDDVLGLVAGGAQLVGDDRLGE
ncbi:hypothetical protein ACWDYJ_23440 [Streptomyces sp. NPDC003042]